MDMDLLGSEEISSETGSGATAAEGFEDDMEAVVPGEDEGEEEEEEEVEEEEEEEEVEEEEDEDGRGSGRGGGGSGGRGGGAPEEPLKRIRRHSIAY